MRKLWEDHITWTRLVIVSFAGGLPDLQATEARLLANQVDIGNAIKPYYGAHRRQPADRAAQGAHPRRGRPAAGREDRRQTQIAQGERGLVRQRATRSPTSCTPPIPTRGAKTRCAR